MKTTSILLSLAIGATAQNNEFPVQSSIRATKLATDRSKRNVTMAGTTDSATVQEKTGNKLPSIAHPRKDHAARERRSQQRVLGNSLHKKLFNNDRGLKETSPRRTETKTDRKTREDVEKVNDRRLMESYNKITTAKTQENADTKAQDNSLEVDQEGDRELKKAKSTKGWRSGPTLSKSNKSSGHVYEAKSDKDYEAKSYKDVSMGDDGRDSTHSGEDEMGRFDYFGSKGGKKGSGKSGKADYGSGKSAKGYSKSAKGYGRLFDSVGIIK